MIILMQEQHWLKTSCHVGHFLGVQNIGLLKVMTNGQLVMHACDLVCIH